MDIFSLFLSFNVWAHPNPQPNQSPNEADKIALQAVFGKNAEENLKISEGKTKLGSRYDYEYKITIETINGNSQSQFGDNQEVKFCPIYLQLMESILEKDQKKVKIIFVTIQKKLKVLGDAIGKTFEALRTGTITEKVSPAEEKILVEKPIVLSKDYFVKMDKNSQLKAIQECKNKYANKDSMSEWEQIEKKIKELPDRSASSDSPNGAK